MTGKDDTPFIGETVITRSPHIADKSESKIPHILSLFGKADFLHPREPVRIIGNHRTHRSWC